MPTENRSSNTEQMVSFPRELTDEMAERIARAAHVCGGGAFEIWEVICEFAYPAAQHQGEAAAWSKDKPETPGAYWIRGFNLSGEFNEAALVQVARDEDANCLMVNLHQSTTERDTGYWYEVDDINAEFEWSGPLYLHPPTSDGFSAGDMADQGAKAFAARDGEAEELRELLRAMTCGYRMAVQAGHARITALGGDCDSVDRMLADFPEYAKAIAATKRKS
ncbi:hypothetical protein [Pseudomonas rubra]|uniref:Uncharacterized protein n=1 Tax=Pseudomonas rubra TaxID=2942627 RepID=A0ABT5P1S4_9PSED|nr:hypothetical protein [Pseudomonas rubra]MDD1012211.1 hypothetical protein [Pseudomonas rubra]MDD1038353.1 hypothetical protein [Pseudomonas rubra]MDD1153389.1 hypothetical protein [Pseudomonas rubra]